MPFLEINGKEYEAKTNFKFERAADAKYSRTEDGQDIGGFLTIYLGLLQYETKAVLQFWDCALAHYKENKPSIEEIEEAIEARIEQDGDTEKLLKEAFRALDDAGFFKKQLRSIWKELTAVPKAKKNETEEETKRRTEQKQVAEAMEQRRKDLRS